MLLNMPRVNTGEYHSQAAGPHDAGLLTDQKKTVAGRLELDPPCPTFLAVLFVSCSGLVRDMEGVKAFRTLLVARRHEGGSREVARRW